MECVGGGLCSGVSASYPTALSVGVLVLVVLLLSWASLVLGNLFVVFRVITFTLSINIISQKNMVFITRHMMVLKFPGTLLEEWRHKAPGAVKILVARSRTLLRHKDGSLDRSTTFTPTTQTAKSKFQAVQPEP